MTKIGIGKTSDFIIKVIMMFTTYSVLIHLATQYSKSAFIFGFLALLFIIAIAINGLSNIFSKK